MNLQSIKQGVLKDILDSGMQSRWLWMSGMTYTNIEEAIFKISGL